MTNNINGIDVSECEHFKINRGFNCYKGYNCTDKECSDCYFKQLKRLQEENEGLKSLNDFNIQKIEVLQGENEKIKNQYNCYACGNCNGKEDYINLEKHHKGLRKQFDELVKRNNTLSLRIEELEKENEKLKETNKYKQALEQIRKEYTNSIFYQCDKTEEECPCHNCIILGQLDRVQNIVKIIDEVLNDN